MEDALKQIVNISLGASSDDYELKTHFLDQPFYIRRFGTDGSLEKIAEQLSFWDQKADAIGLGSLKFPYLIGTERRMAKIREQLKKFSAKIKTPVTTGDALRGVGHEWTLRHIQYKFGDNYFNNARVLFFSGMTSATMAAVMAEYSDNLTFADPVFEDGVPKLLHSQSELKFYASGVTRVMRWLPIRILSRKGMPLNLIAEQLVKRAAANAQVLIVPYFEFYRYLECLSIEELKNKTVITSTAYDDRIQYLKERGVTTVIDSTPKILEKVVGVSVLEAMIIAALGREDGQVGQDDLIELISEKRMDPRVVYPFGQEKNVKRFAFVIHPLSQEDLKRDPMIHAITKITPRKFMETIEKFAAYRPPVIYSRVTGIRSPTGAEAEGWLIVISATPKQILRHGPEFTNRHLLKATKLAKKLGAQIIGLSHMTTATGDDGEFIAKLSDIPVTNGNSYRASCALWAAANAVRRLGIFKVEANKKLKAKTMVVGATSAVGSVCCRLLAKAFEEVYLVDNRDSGLLTLRESILKETPDVKLFISTRADKYLAEMDVIVSAGAGTGNRKPDITRVKSGCVITDIAKPQDFTVEDAERRPDVILIASGEVDLPGNPEMRYIGLPPRTVYAGLAETILLALEGRFESYSVGHEAEWEKVREIYRIGLKHGMALSEISGVKGVITEDTFQAIREKVLSDQSKVPPTDG